MFETFTLAAAVSSLDELGPVPAVADAIEFRLDLATEPLAQLDRYDRGIPLIATNRARWEGGNADDDGRLETLATALAHPDVNAIDVELDSVEAGVADELLGAARETSVAVIVSWHDFEETPPEATIRDRLEAAAAAGDVGKAAVMAQRPADVLPVLRATDRLSSDGTPVATMSMGVAGRHSRVVAPIYGSKIGYAPPARADATAPGQYDLETLARLIDTLS